MKALKGDGKEEKELKQGELGRMGGGKACVIARVGADVWTVKGS